MTKHCEAPEWTYEETANRLLNVPETHFKQFSILTYICGARINEMRSLQMKDIQTIDIPDKGKWIVFRIRNEKNPHRTWKEMPFNPQSETAYQSSLQELIQAHPETETMPFQTYTERWYRKKIRTFLDIHPHALRHLRTHHIDDNSVPGLKALTPRQYQDYFGWESIATSSKYQSRTRTRDLLTHF